MTATELREALHQVAEQTEAPQLDRVAVQRLARVARRRRAAARAFVVGAAAVAVVAVSLDHRCRRLPVAGQGDLTLED